MKIRLAGVRVGAVLALTSLPVAAAAPLGVGNGYWHTRVNQTQA